MKNHNPLFDNYSIQEESHKSDPHFLLSKILIPFGSLLIAGIPLLTSNYQQLPKWVFMSIVSFLILVSAYIVIIIGPALKRLAGELILLIHKRRERSRAIRIYFPQLQTKTNELAIFLADRNDNVINLVRTVGSWSEMLDKQNNNDKYDLEQLSQHVETLREWLHAVQYSSINIGPDNFRPVAFSVSRLVSQYYRFCHAWHRRFETAVKEGRIQSDHLRQLKQEWFTHREKLTKYIDQWKPIAENINAIFEEQICIEYFETLKTIE